MRADANQQLFVVDARQVLEGLGKLVGRELRRAPAVLDGGEKVELGPLARILAVHFHRNAGFSERLLGLGPVGRVDS